MSLEAQLMAVIGGMAGGRVFPDFAPVGTPRPFIVYQAVGGEAINFLEGTAPDKRNARVQISVWSDSRLEASGVAGQIEDAMRAALTLHTTVLGAAVSAFDEEASARGAMQDYSIWY